MPKKPYTLLWYEWIENKYPRVPKPQVPIDSITKAGPSTVPILSGVYFLWDEDTCVYVGKSGAIRGRLADHDRAVSGDWASWLLFSEAEVDYAEAFYIGILRPVRNFMGPALFEKHKSDVLMCREAPDIPEPPVDEDDCIPYERPEKLKPLEAPIGVVIDNAIKQWEQETGLKFVSIDKMVEMEQEMLRQRAETASDLPIHGDACS